jgi:histone acetyltransferase (RNA polymerase elongator complex component)
MKSRHFTIPVFIPMEACPFQCIYCDQEKISGHQKIPDAGEIQKIIQSRLSTIPSDAIIEAGFFGGTFTGLSLEKQEYFLKTVQPFIREGIIKSVRLSTRPDFISPEILEFLKVRHVETIELGAQSMDDEVLRRSGRGHKAETVGRAANMIKKAGFRLGLQMMIGLPGDTTEISLATAQKFVDLGAGDVRIYPTLVIKGTPLEKLYMTGKYTPLSLEDAVSRTSVILPVFENAGVNIIRTGLHPSDGILDSTALVAGPFHVSFKELVLTKLWGDQLMTIEKKSGFNEIIVTVPQNQINVAVGHNSLNKKRLLKRFNRVHFVPDPILQNREFYVDYR